MSSFIRTTPPAPRPCSRLSAASMLVALLEPRVHPLSAHTRQIFVCRLSASSQQDPNPCEVFLVIRDDDVGPLSMAMVAALRR